MSIGLRLYLTLIYTHVILYEVGVTGDDETSIGG